MCTNEKLIQFGNAHYTFINQIFGDKGVREEIAKIWRTNIHKYKMDLDNLDEDSGFDDENHHVIYLKDDEGKFSKEKKWCSAYGCEEPGEEFPPCYQDISRDINDTLCQSYALLKYLGYTFPRGTSRAARKQLQMNMVAMYRMIITNDQFREVLNDFEISSWENFVDGGVLHPDPAVLLENISNVLDEWEAYGYHYFIGKGTCPPEYKKRNTGAAAAAEPAAAPVAMRTRQRGESVSMRTRGTKRQRVSTALSTGGKKSKKSKKRSFKKLKHKFSSKRKYYPVRRSKRLQNKKKNN